MLPCSFAGGMIMKRAIIDVGTNSVRLLEAEKQGTGEWKTLKKEVISSRLGEGIAKSLKLSELAKERTLHAINQFMEEIKADGIADPVGYGTAIFRDADDGPAFAAEIKEKTGLPLRILTGKEEAFYSYIGAAGASSALTAVVDVGGGSTEICMGFGTDIGFKISLPLGCVRCSNEFDVSEARGLGEMKKHCFALLRKAENMEAVKRWIFVGGTATSMAAMAQGLEVYDASKVQGFIMKPEMVSEMLRRLYKMSYEERCHVPGLRPDRADIIVAGVAIVDSLMEYFAIPEIMISDRDLQEGLLDSDIIHPEG
jgi:exopolyphosphatase / guanosine-5'-triphosphate,3'-diphosphate pyrophosphatase